jgi:hypothetical protein
LRKTGKGMPWQVVDDEAKRRGRGERRGKTRRGGAEEDEGLWGKIEPRRKKDRRLRKTWGLDFSNETEGLKLDFERNGGKFYAWRPNS